MYDSKFQIEDKHWMFINYPLELCRREPFQMFLGIQFISRCFNYFQMCEDFSYYIAIFTELSEKEISNYKKIQISITLCLFLE